MTPSLAAVLDVGEISISEDICDLFKKCKEDPHQFWESLKFPPMEAWNAKASFEIVALQTYLTGRVLTKRRQWDTILWRFFAKFWYNLEMLLGDGQINRTSNLESRLLKAISSSPLVGDDDVTIKNHLHIWTAAGLRYHKICEQLDDGALFLLPHLSDNV
jgi:hypothetical protein